MTREDPQLKLRLPEALRDALWKQSVANKRTMNGELVARLEASLANDETLETRVSRLEATVKTMQGGS